MVKRLEIGFVQSDLEVVGYSERDLYYKIKCKRCGSLREVWHYNVLRLKSCSSCAHAKDTRRTIGGKTTKEYAAYAAMIARIFQTMPSWKKRCENTIYDGMEIETSWTGQNGFDNFYRDIGPAFEGAYLDREDNSKGYIKGNVRWATASESNKNKRNAALLTAFGKTQNIVDWSKETELSEACIRNRINVLGWDPEKTLSIQADHKNKTVVSKNAVIIEAFGKKQTVTEWSRETGINHGTLDRRLHLLFWPIEKALTTPVRKIVRKNSGFET